VNEAERKATSERVIAATHLFWQPLKEAKRQYGTEEALVAMIDVAGVAAAAVGWSREDFFRVAGIAWNDGEALTNERRS
jgi:hypothetical protein